MTLDRKPFCPHVTASSRADVSTASRPQTLTSSSSTVTAGRAAAEAGSWSAVNGRTFPRHAAGPSGGAAAPPAGRRRIADVDQPSGRLGRATSTNGRRPHSRSYSDLLSDDPLTPPLPPPPPLDLAEPRGRAACGTRGGARRGDGGCSWTLDRHHSTATAPTCANSTATECVVDCRQTGYPVYDV